MSTVAPPAQGTWWDRDAICARVLARLRLHVGDADADRIRELADIAAGHINNELDRATAMTPASAVDPDTLEPLDTNVTPTILEALERVTVELYTRGKSDLRDVGLIVSDTSAVIDVVRDDISTNKSRFGFA